MTLQQELDEKLSALVREYEEKGLSPEQISESLSWHEDLAESRSTEEETETVRAD